MSIRNKMHTINELYRLIFRSQFPHHRTKLARILSKMGISTDDFRWAVFYCCLELWDKSGDFLQTFHLTNLKPYNMAIGLLFSGIKMTTAHFPDLVVATKHVAPLVRKELRSVWKHHCVLLERAFFMTWTVNAEWGPGWIWEHYPRTLRDRFQLVNWSMSRKYRLPVNPHFTWENDRLSQWALQLLDLFLENSKLHCQLEEFAMSIAQRDPRDQQKLLVDQIKDTTRKELFKATAPDREAPQTFQIQQRIWMQCCVLFLKHFPMVQQEGWPMPPTDPRACGKTTHVWAGLALIRILSELVGYTTGIFEFYPDFLSVQNDLLLDAWHCLRRVCIFVLGESQTTMVLRGIEAWSVGQRPMFCLKSDPAFRGQQVAAAAASKPCNAMNSPVTPSPSPSTTISPSTTNFEGHRLKRPRSSMETTEDRHRFARRALPANKEKIQSHMNDQKRSRVITIS